jgi:hypothetical protein
MDIGTHRYTCFIAGHALLKYAQCYWASIMNPMESLSEMTEIRLRRQDYELRHWMLIIIGAIIEIFILIPIVSPFFNGLLQPAGQLIFLYAALLAVLTFLYSLTASLAFSPKRIVSPLLIQMMSAVGIILFILTTQLRPILLSQYAVEGISYMTVLGNIIVFGILGLPLLAVLGFVQTELVRRLVGLNGGLDDIGRKTYVLPVAYDKVRDVLTDEVFYSAYDLPKPKEEKGFLIVETSRSSTYQIIMVLRMKDETSSILSTATYEKKYYSIIRSKLFEGIRDKIVEDIAEKLSIKAEVRETSDPATVKAAKLALGITETPLASMRNIPRFYVVALILTAFVGIGLTVYFYVFNHDQNLYISSLVLIAVAVIIELLPTMRESWKEKRTEDESEKREIETARGER